MADNELTDEERAELEALRAEKAQREEAAAAARERAELEALRAERDAAAAAREEREREAATDARIQEIRDRNAKIMEPGDDLSMPLGQKITLIVIFGIVIAVSLWFFGGRGH